MSKLSQKDYLKKYLSSDDKLKKKKKKSGKDKKVKASTVKIIDDDEYQHGHNEIDESELFTMNEEAPQIVGIIDERAPEVLMKQEYIDSGKWKKIGETSKSSKTKKNKGRSLSKDQSPQPNRNRGNSSDASPPRIRAEKPEARSRKDSDASPPRRGRGSPDASPPRRNRKNSNESPPRSRQRKDSDNSPPRRRQRQDSDNSPPRARKRRDSDASPPRRHRDSPGKSHKRESSTLSSSRRRSKSPSRKRRSRWSPDIKQEPQSPRNQDSSPPRSSRMTKTLDGKASGLQDAKTLKIENDAFKKRQDKMFKEMRPEMLGRDAEVVVRDRRGRNKDYEKEVEEERRKSAFEEARKKDYDRWGKGLKQIEELEKRYQEHVHEANKPLARGADDEDLQDHLKQQERLDDPMLAYMRKKKQEENRKKGVKEMPKYKGQFPDNRYNIPPGYRWDGVDRSNGYEKKYFSMISSKKSIEEEAYRYSTEDM